MSKSISIVTHCYAKRLPQYATFLRYQFTSLMHSASWATPPVRFFVCYCRGDYETELSLGWCLRVLDQHRHNVQLALVEVNESRIFPRCFGRHEASQRCDTDVVWFTDVDYLFMGNCLPTVADHPSLWDEKNSMVFVRTVRINQTHELGDNLVLRADYYKSKQSTLNTFSLGPQDLDTLFVPKRYNRAIGGVQIVRGDFARKHGFLPDAPPHNGLPFDRGSRDDRAYRQQCLAHGKIVGIEAPGVYRLRHTQTTRRLQDAPPPTQVDTPSA